MPFVIYVRNLTYVFGLQLHNWPIDSMLYWRMTRGLRTSMKELNPLSWSTSRTLTTIVALFLLHLFSILATLRGVVRVGPRYTQPLTKLFMHLQRVVRAKEVVVAVRIREEE